MTDHDALLRAIIANRADDTPRLAFADWCEENGQPERGEFIRVQCDLARLGGCQFISLGQEKACIDTARPNSISCEWCELRRRERELLSGHSRGWIYDFVPGSVVSSWSPHNPMPYLVLPGPRFVSPELTRGFVSSVALDWSDWRTHADAILTRQPIERVKLTTRPEIGLPLVDVEMLAMAWPGIEFELPPER